LDISDIAQRAIAQELTTEAPDARRREEAARIADTFL